MTGWEIAGWGVAVIVWVLVISFIVTVFKKASVSYARAQAQLLFRKERDDAFMARYGISWDQGTSHQQTEFNMGRIDQITLRGKG